MIKNTKFIGFGINYTKTPDSKLAGCINDVTEMSKYLTAEFKIPCQVYRDDLNYEDTTLLGIKSRLYELALESWRDEYKFIWIHYSGHGSYMKDSSKDEKDGRDECLVPADFQTSGMLKDDEINRIFQFFNPKTRIVFVIDACNSATVGDLVYCWEGGMKTVENATKVASQVLTISGCLDAQTSADAFGLLGDKKPIGALTANLILALKENKALINNIFQLITIVRKKLKDGKFDQIPKLCSSYDLNLSKELVPAWIYTPVVVKNNKKRKR